MDDILRQLGVLFVGCVPTVILFILLYFCYTGLFYAPLRRTLALRRERTAGAIEKAHAAMAIAEAKTQEYEARLRAARLDLQADRERQIAAWNAARETALAEAREAAAVKVRSARSAVAAEAAQTRATLEQAADALAAEVLATILPRSFAQEGARS